MRRTAHAGLFDKEALFLLAVILLSEAAIAALFFALVPQLAVHLLDRDGSFHGSRVLLLQRSAAYAGYALSAYGTAKLPAQPFCGWVADRLGARRVLATGLVICLLAILLMAQAPTALVFTGICALYGLAVAVVWPAVYAMVGDDFDPLRRGRVLAAIGGAEVAGTAAGFGLGALVVDYGSLARAFGLVFALNALALVLAFAVPHGRKASGKDPSPVPLAHAIKSLLSPGLMMLWAILALISISVTVLVPDLRPYSSAALHLRFSSFSLLLAIPATLAVLTLIPSGFVADKFGRTGPMMVGVALWPVCMVGLALTQSLPLVLLIASIAAFGYALGMPAWNASLVDLSSTGSRGLQAGTAAAVQAVGLAIGPAIGGLTVAHFGIVAPFRLSAAVMLIGAALTFAYRLQTRGLYKVMMARARR